MNRLMFVGSLIGICFFILFLVLTFIAQEWFKDFARDYINRRIEPGITRGVVVFESEVLPTLATQPEVAAKATAEIASYRADPFGYIERVTSGRLTEQQPSSDPGWLTKVAGIVNQETNALKSLPKTISDHFRRVFDHLVMDLRLFAITNIIAFTVVALLMRGYDARFPRLVVQAFIPFLATCYALTVYIKQDWFFNLLLDLHMGAGYPFMVVMTMLDLWNRLRRGQLRKRAGQLTHEMLIG